MSGVEGLFFTIILSGGIVAGLFEWFRNWMMRKREEYMDISKIKIEYISKSLPYYSQSAYYFNGLSSYIKSKRRNDYSQICMYYVSNGLRLRHEYFKKFGVIQLDNIEAEEILESISQNLSLTITDKMGIRDMSLMISLTEENILFHEFKNNLLQNYSELLRKFEERILTNKEVLEVLEKHARWFAELITLEVNHNYRIWYGQDVVLTGLSDDTLQFLKNQHLTYYDRITSFGQIRLLSMRLSRNRKDKLKAQ